MNDDALVGSVWELDYGEFTLVVLGRELIPLTFDLGCRCLTLASNHRAIRPGGVELWHPSNLENARRIA